ncbi:MAG: hypothetical protein ACI91R_002360 [Vicingaceae bacterium]|jgi:hypothetical protein
MEFRMKIFVSWSGKRSKAVAEMMSDWLKCVIQASQPWISTRDIDRGAIWFSEINDKLKDVSVGVVCLTQENKNKPWILFETGALAKGLTTNRVCTFLVDLSPEDLEDPLGQFNHTTPEKSSVWALTRTINDCLNEKALDERILQQVFETYWPQFDYKFQIALKENQPEEVVPPRSEQEMLGEILNHTRGLSNRIHSLESELDYSSNFNSRNNKYNSNSHPNPDLLNNKIASDKSVELKARSMIVSGKYTNKQIVDTLVKYGMTDLLAKKIVSKWYNESKFDPKRGVNDDDFP